MSTLAPTADTSISSEKGTAPRARAKAHTLPRVALRVGEAAEALGVSVDHFSKHIAPELRVVRRGAVKLYAVAELEGWLDRSATRILDEVG